MTTLITDNFTRANENPLDNGNWSVWGAFNPFQLLSNVAVGTVNGFNNASLVTSGSFANDQWARATLGAINNHFVGPMVRCGAGGGYGFQRTSTGGQLFIWNPFGTYGVLDSPVYANSPGDVYEIEVVGTALVGKHNGVQVTAPVSDATFASGLPGLYTFSGIDPVTLFEAGDFSTPDPPVPPGPRPPTSRGNARQGILNRPAIPAVDLRVEHNVRAVLTKLKENVEISNGIRTGTAVNEEGWKRRTVSLNMLIKLGLVTEEQARSVWQEP